MNHLAMRSARCAGRGVGRFRLLALVLASACGTAPPTAWAQTARSLPDRVVLVDGGEVRGVVEAASPNDLDIVLVTDKPFDTSPVAVTVDIEAGSDKVTVSGDDGAKGYKKGMLVTGRGIPKGTTVNLATSNGFTLSAKAAETLSKESLSLAYGRTKKNIDTVLEVFFDGEPAELRSARTNLRRRDAAAALADLAKVKEEELQGKPAFVTEEMAFVRAASQGLQALQSGAKMPPAAEAVKGFLAKYPRSFHAYDMQELLGDLVARAGKLDEAAAAYAFLEKGPPSYRIRATALKARLLREQKKYADALRLLDDATRIELQPGDAAGTRAKREAELGRAQCLSRLDKAADAIAAARGVIRQADSDAKELLGRAFNVLGDAQRAAGGRDEDAVIAYLTVDLVYNTAAETHAEALYNLVDLWQRTKNPERSREARQTLESQYPNSPWTKRLAAAKPS